MGQLPSICNVDGKRRGASPLPLSICRSVRQCPKGALLGSLAEFWRFLPSFGLELSFCREAFSFVLRHGFWVVQNVGRVRFYRRLYGHRRLFLVGQRRVLQDRTRKCDSSAR